MSQLKQYHDGSGNAYNTLVRREEPLQCCIKHRQSCSLSPASDEALSTSDANPKPRPEISENPVQAAVMRWPTRKASSPRAADSRRSPSHDGSHLRVSRPGAGPGIQPSSPNGWATDLGLMNHFTSLTSTTLPGASRHLWQMEIPREAIAYPFLMHQILSVSAFHLASLDSSQNQTYLSRAFYHQQYAICGIKEEVTDITPINCHALFIASSLLFFGAFATTSQATARPCHREVDNILDIFTLIRGVSAILSSSKENIRNGIFGEFMECSSPPERTGLLNLLLERLPAISKGLTADRRISHEARALAEEAMDGLRVSIGRAKTAATELSVAIVWPMTLSNGFLTLLRVHHTAALVVVAHYCVVLHAAGSEFWFVRGWGRRLIDAIAESLLPSWHEEIQWPLGLIKSGENSGSLGRDRLRLEVGDSRFGQEVKGAV